MGLRNDRWHGRHSDGLAYGTGVPPVCSPALVARRIYSAFGEPVDTANSGSFNALHYGYAGAYGYEEANANALDPLAQLGWLHVGERYYAPELGRFVQRDPIGISGRVNCYAYVRGTPTTLVDPKGLYWDYDDILNPDGSVTRHFYDRGWTGWFMNEYKYSVRAPTGMPPPLPPRTIDQRVVAVIIRTEIGICTGAVKGALAAGPEGAVIQGAIGGLLAFGGGILIEVLY